jgi:hypothetical protein
VIQTEERLIDRYAELRAWAHRSGHPLAQKFHGATQMLSPY